MSRDGGRSDGTTPDYTVFAGKIGVMDAPRPTSDELMALLTGVIDPELGSDIVDLGMVRDATVGDDGRAAITIALTTAGCPLRAQLQRDVKARIGSLPGIVGVDLHWGELSDEERSAAMAKARWNVREQATATAVPPSTRVITIASGKGGVGKSSVTVNLAAALAAKGYAVGVLDADIWGFSIPRMLGVEGRLQGAETGERKIAPHHKTIEPSDAPGSVGTTAPGHLEVVSMGLLVDNEADALMWRGLMLNRAVQHFLEDVDWGDLDYLLIDMPPGTGDVAMGLARMLPRAEMIIVTTPSLSAQKVAIRAATMARKSYVRVAGVIENMSSFRCEHGTEHALFGSGGGEALAHEIGAPLLGQVPIEAAVAAGGDAGVPVVLGDGPAADAFRAIADVIVDEAVPPVAMAGCSARMLDAAVAALDRLDEEHV
jgi:ATP-binding protein involved in chromosome partitioning